MLTRRSVAAAAAGAVMALAQNRPRIVLRTGPLEGLVFHRAYSASPDAGDYPLLTGMFPHAYARREPPSLTRFFEIMKAPDERTIRVAVGEGLHLSLSIRYPGKLEDATTNVLISTVDVMPTVMALAGLRIPEGLHGRDLSAVLTGATSDQPSAVFSEGLIGRAGEWRMIVRGFDKLVTDRQLKPLHLYNLADDAAEENDLAQHPGNALKVDELRALLRDWQKRTGDAMDPSGLRRR